MQRRLASLDKYYGIIVEEGLDTHLFSDHFDYHCT